MVQIIPHARFKNVEMMATVQLLSQKGNMKIQEAHARATDEIMKETYIAGYEQAMKDFGLTNESKMADDAETR
jgi:hypothetical protein